MFVKCVFGNDNSHLHFPCAISLVSALQGNFFYFSIIYFNVQRFNNNNNNNVVVVVVVVDNFTYSFVTQYFGIALSQMSLVPPPGCTTPHLIVWLTKERSWMLLSSSSNYHTGTRLFFDNLTYNRFDKPTILLFKAPKSTISL